MRGGDRVSFPIKYFNGNAPLSKDSIALSYLAAKQLHVLVGSTIRIKYPSTKATYKVSGIYQDITNGGITAKVSSLPRLAVIQSEVINVDLVNTSNANKTIAKYHNLFPNMKFTVVSQYIKQTMGGVIQQIKNMKLFAIALMILLTMVVTAIRMIAYAEKSKANDTLLALIGLPKEKFLIRDLYAFGFTVVVSIFVGNIIANTSGEYFLQKVWGTVGAPGIIFSCGPLDVFVTAPLLVIAACFITIILLYRKIYKSAVDIRKLSVE